MVKVYYIDWHWDIIIIKIVTNYFVLMLLLVLYPIFHDWYI